MFSEAFGIDFIHHSTLVLIAEKHIMRSQHWFLICFQEKNCDQKKYLILSFEPQTYHKTHKVTEIKQALTFEMFVLVFKTRKKLCNYNRK